MLTFDQVNELSLQVRDGMAKRIEMGEEISPHLLVLPNPDKPGQLNGPTIMGVGQLQSSGQMKELLARLIDKLLSMPEVELVIHVTEAWVKRVGKMEREQVERECAEGMEKYPEGRGEALNLHIYTPDCQWICTSMIERNPTRVDRAELVCISSPAEGMIYEGRFVRERRLAS